MEKKTHPVAIGTITNIGTIASWKYVRFGVGKYRYFTLEGKHDFPQEAITEIISSRHEKDNR